MPSNESLERRDCLRPADERHRLAECVRSACLDAALTGFQEAKMGGLCDEGAWENAIGAIRMVDIDGIVARLEPT